MFLEEINIFMLYFGNLYIQLTLTEASDENVKYTTGHLEFCIMVIMNVGEGNGTPLQYF